MQQEQWKNQARQSAVQKLQEATQRVSRAQDPSEQARAAEEARYHAEAVASFSGSSQDSSRQRTALSVEAIVPSAEAFQQLTQRLQPQTTPGLKEVSFRREGGTPRVRIQATTDALPQIQRILSEVAQIVESSYSGSMSSPQQYQQQQ